MALKQPLPLPEGDTIVEVLAPAIAAPAISADEAVALARESMTEYVGKAPRIQLVRVTNRDPSSRRNGLTGWVILSTDVPALQTGAYNPTLQSEPPPSITIYAVYTWVWVTLDGEVLGASQNSYATADSVPPLPE